MPPAFWARATSASNVESSLDPSEPGGVVVVVDELVVLVLVLVLDVVVEVGVLPLSAAASAAHSSATTTAPSAAILHQLRCELGASGEVRGATMRVSSPLPPCATTPGSTDVASLAAIGTIRLVASESRGVQGWSNAAVAKSAAA